MSRATVCALVLALTFGAGLSWCAFKAPLTLYDGLDPIVAAHASPSAVATFRSALGAEAYFRPLRVAQIKAFFDLQPSNPVHTYTVIHAALLCVTLLLFVAYLRPRTSNEGAAAAMALIVLVGHHAFLILAAEQYPINHFLEIVTLSLAAAAVARGEPRAWKAFAVPALFVIGALTLESGVLVAVVAVACWMVGWRGASGRAVLACVLLAAGYIWLRVGVFGVASPGLDERASGYWLDRLEPSELVSRFGDSPLRFYIYNVFSSLLDVTLSQPRDGRWIMVSRWLNGGAEPWMVVHLASSLVLSAAIVWALVRAVTNWRSGILTERDRFVLVALALVGANSVLSYAYIKDEVLSVGAAFYAAAAYAVVASYLADLPRSSAKAVAVALMLAIGSVLWTSRAAGTFVNLRSLAYKTAADWARYEPAVEMPREWSSPAVRRLYEDLRRSNLARPVPHPYFTRERAIQGYVEIR